ncbi:hypothetical protein PDENDC454_13350 [Paenibacillus dendritiformis C454]|uniref:Uncharacterized protein n=1 Tax=Paenibacillus dendritiformis C454 TaxID=1131935 RepID=H3SGL5_9BACL|nr:hypothetical protein PDENDC454_13350 [Paenibacillus dendritiformis C454]
MLAASIAKAGYARKVPKKEVGFIDAGFMSPRFLLRIRQEGRRSGTFVGFILQNFNQIGYN